MSNVSAGDVLDREQVTPLAETIDRIRADHQSGRIGRYEAIERIQTVGRFTDLGAADVLDHRQSAKARYEAAFAEADAFAAALESLLACAARSSATGGPTGRKARGQVLYRAAAKSRGYDERSRQRPPFQRRSR